jgi:hypothetical protein
VQGPVRTICIQRLSLGCASAQREGSWLQSLLAGSLRIPIRVQGVTVQLAPAPTNTATAANSSAALAEGSSECGAAAQPAPQLQPQPGSQRPKPKLPLGILQLVTVTVDDLAVQAEVRSMLGHPSQLQVGRVLVPAGTLLLAAAC